MHSEACAPNHNCRRPPLRRSALSLSLSGFSRFGSVLEGTAISISGGAVNHGEEGRKGARSGEKWDRIAAIINNTCLAVAVARARSSGIPGMCSICKCEVEEEEEEEEEPGRGEDNK